MEAYEIVRREFRLVRRIGFAELNTPLRTRASNFRVRPCEILGKSFCDRFTPVRCS
jgi:hypothetical protein